MGEVMHAMGNRRFRLVVLLVAAIAVVAIAVVSVTYYAGRAAAEDALRSSSDAAGQASVADNLRKDQSVYRQGLVVRVAALQQAAAEQAAAEQAAADQAAADQAATDQAANQAAADEAAPSQDGTADSPADQGTPDSGAGDGAPGTDTDPGSGTNPPPLQVACPGGYIEHLDDDGNPVWCEAPWQCAIRNDDGECTSWLL